MTPDQVRAVADSRKELFQDCPYCSEMCPLFDRLIELMQNAGGYPVTFEVSGGIAHDRRTVHGGMVRLYCDRCRNTRRILTPLGQALAELTRAEPAAGEEQIPF